MKRGILARWLALLGASGVTMACNAGGETIGNPFPDTEVEPNDTVAQATSLGGPGVATAKGICEAAQAADHFRMNAGTAGTATAQIAADVTLQVALLASNGTVLATSADAVSPYDVSAAVDSAGGAVLLRITCDAAGSYDGSMETP